MKAHKNSPSNIVPTGPTCPLGPCRVRVRAKPRRIGSFCGRPSLALLSSPPSRPRRPTISCHLPIPRFPTSIHPPRPAPPNLRRDVALRAIRPAANPRHLLPPRPQHHLPWVSLSLRRFRLLPVVWIGGSSVFGCPAGTTADDLFPLFDKYGEVVDIYIPRDRRWVWGEQVRRLFDSPIRELTCVRCVGWLGGVEYEIRGWRRVGAGSWFVRDSFICVCLSKAMAVGLVTPEASRSWGTSTRTRRRRQLIGSMVRLSSLPLEIDVCHLRGEIGLLFTCCVFCLQGEW